MALHHSFDGASFSQLEKQASPGECDKAARDKSNSSWPYDSSEDGKQEDSAKSLESVAVDSGKRNSSSLNHPGDEEKYSTCSDLLLNSSSPLPMKPTEHTLSASIASKSVRVSPVSGDQSSTDFGVPTERPLSSSRRPASMGARLYLGGLEDSGRGSGLPSHSGSSEEKLSPGVNGVGSGPTPPSLSSRAGGSRSNNGVIPRSNGKKKGSSNWFISSYKQKTEDFRKYFKDVPSDEKLLADYSCALQKDILIHGRLYITQHWFCFYANIFSWETVVTIQCSEVTAITKEKTARVLPNAMQIAAGKDRYFFSSFASRDKTFLMAFRVWQNALMNEPLNTSQLWNYARQAYTLSPPGCEDWDSTVEQEETYSQSIDDGIEGQVSTAASVTSSQGASPSSATGGQTVFDTESLSSDISITSPTEDEDMEVSCPEHEHKGRTMVDDVFNFPANKAFEMLFSDNPFMHTFFEHRKTTDVVLQPWPEEFNESGFKSRQLSFTVTLSGFSFGPKTTPSIENQTLDRSTFRHGEYMCVDAEALNDPNLPYGDNFFIHNRYCISQKTRSTCRIVCHTEIVYKKSVFSFIRSIIEKNVWSGLNGYFKDLNYFLREESDSNARVQDLLQVKPDRYAGRSTNHKLHQDVKYRKKTNHHHHHTTKKTATGPSSSDHVHLSKAAAALHLPDIPVKLISDEKTSVKMISVILICLVIFNVLLFWKLLSHDSTLAHLQQSEIAPTNSGSVSHEEMMAMLNKQQQFYDRELERWKALLESSRETIQTMQSILESYKGAESVKTEDRARERGDL